MTEMRMPKLGMSMEEGKVLEWMVGDGDEVKEGQEIVNVTSDTGKLEKVLEAPTSGKISFKVETEELVRYGTVIAAID